MKFQCKECNAIMFGIEHSFTGIETADPTSMFMDNPRWHSEPQQHDYIALCHGCHEAWRADNLDGLKEAMQKDGVLK